MKKTILSFIMGIALVSLHAQIANGDFETWQEQTLYEHPTTSFDVSSSNLDAYASHQIPNVTRVSMKPNTFMRIENIGSGNRVTPGYFIFGEKPTDGSTFTGGFPITDLNATGIAMDLKYNLMRSSGIVWVQFKNGETPVGPGNAGPGTYVFNISGSELWTRTEFVFDSALDPSTTTCVIGIASADMINNDTPYASKAFIEVDNISFINSMDAVPNGDFETWNAVHTATIPANVWVNVHPTHSTFAQSTEAYSGNYAMELTTTSIDGTTVVGSVKMAHKNTRTGEAEPYIKVRKNSQLSFMYNNISSSGKNAMAKIEFYNNGEMVYKYTQVLKPTEEYTAEVIKMGPILKSAGITATHIIPSFYSTDELITILATTPSRAVLPNDRFLLDDVEITHMPEVSTTDTKEGLSAATGIKEGSDDSYDLIPRPTEISPEITTENPVQVFAYPNPTYARVSFNFGELKSGTYYVYNQSGALISVKKYTATQLIHDLSGQPQGVYLFKFEHHNGLESIKVVKH